MKIPTPPRDLTLEDLLAYAKSRPPEERVDLACTET